MSGDRQLPTPLWDPELNRQIHEALPGFVTDSLAILTHLGDGALLVGLAMIFYWFGGQTDWRKRGKILAIAVATLALSAGIKGILEIPRPLFVAEPAFAFAPESYPGWSTPSAHAMGAAAIYGGLAVVMHVGKAWQRYLLAGVIIAIVCLSRVTLGVHYVGDVLLGAGLGLFLVGLAVWIVDETPKSILPLFFLSFTIAVLAYVAGSREFVTLSIGASLGGLITWWLIHDTDPEPLGASEFVLGIFFIPIFLLFGLFHRYVEFEVTMAVGTTEVPAMAGIEMAGYAVLFSLALALPHLAVHIDSNRHVQTIQETLPFSGRVLDTEAIQERYEERVHEQ